METATTTVIDAPTQPSTKFDARAHLLATLPKPKDEILKVTHIAGALFRATWFVPMKIGDCSRNGDSGMQGKIRESYMLRCTPDAIEKLPRQ